MGTTNREITVYSCDADDCKVAKPVIDGGHYPESFITGMVDLTSDPDGPTAPWAACKVAHIGKAVTAIKVSAFPSEVAAQPDREETEDDGRDNEPPESDQPQHVAEFGGRTYEVVWAVAFDADDIKNAAKQATDKTQEASDIGSTGGAEALAEAAEKNR